MRERFADLLEDLLRAGISPRRANRYVRELSDHHADLIEHLEAQGLSHQEAEQSATQRLGSHDTLLLPMLADARFRSMASRWPAVVYLVLPLVSQIILALLAAIFLIAAASTPLRPALIDLASGAAILWLTGSVILSWAAILAAHRRRASMRWPVIAALAVATLAAAVNIGVTMPVAEIHGEITLALTHPSPLSLVTLAALSLLPLVLHFRARSAT
ncbi:permease prefix domain 1-containing protein [Devosia riboflavina]|uniref:permease prefix domain 1-containing protein n=1 Tax=Devosia riboflavina TaxID=46914 RepID=UPI00068BD1ED|nr:permease prefix domain 1-containing protein [Devosia riboflavina]